MRLLALILAALLVLQGGIARAGNWQTPGEIQQPKGPWLQPKAFQQPRGPWLTPGAIQTPRPLAPVRVEEAGPCIRRIEMLADALFDFDQALLRPDAVQTLSSVGPMLKEQGDHPVTVEGHTDAKGSDDYNERLSLRRAASVRDWLVAEGYVRSAAVRGLGEARPVAANEHGDGSDDPEGRQRNRRVEILIDACK